LTFFAGPFSIGAKLGYEPGERNKASGPSGIDCPLDGRSQVADEGYTMDPVLLVSADSHITMPEDAVEEYLEPQYRPYLDSYRKDREDYRTKLAFLLFTEEALEVLDTEGLIRSGGDIPWDLERRLVEMDREGIAAEMLFPRDISAPLPFFDHSAKPYPPDVRLGGIRAYHRFVADFMAGAHGRLFAVADPGPCTDIDAVVQEIRWVADHGFRSLYLPGFAPDPDLPPLHSDLFEPIWRTCDELGLTLALHAGHGVPQGNLLALADRLRSLVGEDATPQQLQTAFKAGLVPDSHFSANLHPQAVLWELLAGGVFDRYPNLKLVLTEVRADWVPGTLAYLDRRYREGDTPLRKPPSEYWRQNCMSGASSIKRSEVRLRHEIGVDKLMFGRDYPHREGTWPNTWDWLRDALSDVPEDEARLILGENAVSCYGLDRPYLKEIAARIGPQVHEVVGSQSPVSPALLENFNLRSGYGISRDNVDIEALQRVTV
jgi:predicted TIM-barrel fold metal-dependent hydrolase